MRKTKAEKQIDTQIETAFRVHFNCIQIPIMDIPKIYSRARKEMSEGKTADESLKNMVKDFAIGGGK